MSDLFSFLSPETIAAAGATWKLTEPILKNFATDTLEKHFQSAASNKLKELLKRDEWKKALAKSMQAFSLQFFEALQKAGLSENDCQKYQTPLKIFMRDLSVATTLTEVVTNDESVIFTTLAKKWESLELEPLPNTFDWIELTEAYQKTVAEILEKDKTLQGILALRATQQIEESTQRLAGPAPDFNLTNYASALRKRYGLLKLDSLYPDPNRRDMALKHIFVEQSVRSAQDYNPRIHELPYEYRKDLFNTVELEKELDKERIRLERERFFNQSSKPVFEAIEKSENHLAVILGDPGYGKSVLLNHLALKWAELPTVKLTTKPLPLLLELKAYARNLQEKHCKNILSYFSQSPGCAYQLNLHQLTKLLEQGEALLLLDGFDEIFNTSLRKQIAEEVVGLSVKYPRGQIIVTSRIIGYDLIAPILRDGGFRHFMLQELNDEQQRKFLEQWHEQAYDEPKERQEKYQRMTKAIQDVRAIRELAENPLLLTLMAILNRYQELPRDRNELYEQATRVLLHQWDAERAIQSDPELANSSIDLRDKQAMLRAVAFFMQSDPQMLSGNAIAANELEDILFKYLDSQGHEKARSLAKRLVLQLRERNYILCLLGADYYAFVHRTFLEFFCAAAWVWRYEKGEKGRRYTIEKLGEETFEKYWHDEKWHEALKLISAKLEPEAVEEILTSLLENPNARQHEYRNIFLTAGCFAVQRNKKRLRALGFKLANQIETLIKKYPWYHLNNIVDAIVTAEPKLEDTKNWLKELLNRKDAFAKLVGVQAITKYWKDETDLYLLLKDYAQNHSDPFIRSWTIMTISVKWKNEPDVFAIIKDSAKNDSNSNVRSSAIHMLASKWKDRPDVFALVKNYAQNDSDTHVRASSIVEIANIWKNKPDIFTLVKNYAQNDSDTHVKVSAIEALAENWKDRPDVFELVKDHTQNVSDTDVRYWTIKALAANWKNEPDVFALLKDYAQNDSNSNVRRSAIEALAKNWKDEPENFALVKNYAQNDSDSDVRRSAIQVLAKNWNDDPAIFALVKDYAQNDLDNFVRAFAIQELAENWKDEPEVAILLKKLADKDNDDGVRKVAAKQLSITKMH